MPPVGFVPVKENRMEIEKCIVKGNVTLVFETAMAGPIQISVSKEELLKKVAKISVEAEARIETFAHCQQIILDRFTEKKNADKVESNPHIGAAQAGFNQGLGHAMDLISVARKEFEEKSRRGFAPHESILGGEK